ncbi:MAG: hypothetical protein Unbinned96contig1002_36 [Prokaryotic dsDNA virus sp.]|nr:MAG: hypothetical protein Unbinned96contig1002_36 [Prokaryotic dsDNA virus sp.]|tara:strand:- start:3864 stop:4058 length:195 start_codon:yes stop_codon:yes gene_type:complete
MRLNFNTSIYNIIGVVFGVNYWSSSMDDEFLNEATISGEVEHELQFFLLVVGFSFTWYTLRENE